MARIVKPQPLVMGGKAYYTLSSYDPVSVEVHVTSVTDDDVSLILGDIARQAGVPVEKLSDDAWVRENIPGVSGADDLRSRVRAEIQQANAEAAEDEKTRRCLEALAERLGQSVPPEQVRQLQQALVGQLEAGLAARGRTLEWYAAQMGGSRAMLEDAFAQEAQEMAEQEAALDAYAREKKLSVDDSEYPELLGLDAKSAQKLMDQAKAQGHAAELRDGALRVKAQRAVVGEASCTYVQETPAEAAQRLEQLRSRAAAPSPLAGAGASTAAPSPIIGADGSHQGKAPTQAPSRGDDKEQGFRLV